MSFVESLRAFSSPRPPPAQEAHVWDCSNRGQVLAAAFEVHEVAMSRGFMPDEATRLSMSLAQLCSEGGAASVTFTDAGWKLQVAGAGPSLATAEYERAENA